MGPSKSLGQLGFAREPGRKLDHQFLVVILFRLVPQIQIGDGSRHIGLECSFGRRSLARLARPLAAIFRAMPRVSPEAFEFLAAALANVKARHRRVSRSRQRSPLGLGGVKGQRPGNPVASEPEPQ
jgi:hypothetical protein